MMCFTGSRLSGAFLCVYGIASGVMCVVWKICDWGGGDWAAGGHDEQLVFQVAYIGQ